MNDNSILFIYLFLIFSSMLTALLPIQISAKRHAYSLGNNLACQTQGPKTYIFRAKKDLVVRFIMWFPPKQVHQNY